MTERSLIKSCKGKRLVSSFLILFLLCFFGCSAADESRPEFSYSDARVTDELHRLEQNAQMEEVLGHDTQKLNTLLSERGEDLNPNEAKALLVRCRDAYLKGMQNKSGVPLGGIGAGSVELWPDGGLHDWRIAGNWDLAQEADFSCFALRTESAGHKKMHILQDDSWAGRKRTRDIRYEGRFPFVFLDYGAGAQPVSVKSTAFSPFIPHDAENSCLPVACFTFEVTNNSDDPVHTSLLFALGTAPFLKDGSAGFEKESGVSTISYESGPNAIAISTISDKATYAAGWEGNILPREFEASGKLGGIQRTNNGKIAICSEVGLAPRETKEVVFLLSWYFPDQRQRPTASYKMEEKFKELGTTQEAESNKYIGRRYNKFGSLKNINQYFFENLGKLKGETLAWVNSIYGSNLDKSLQSLLCNSLYPLFKTSFWTEDGRFNILESTNGCANPDCVHVRYYGSIPLALLFPELDQQVLRRLAKYRGPFGGAEVGQIPEQFYGFSLEFPFGRPLVQNNLSFVLMVYRDYLWTGNKKFLEEMWPAVEEAMALIAQKDTDEDGLPDSIGILQSYDDYDMGDSPIYTSVIWLASLRAAEEMALLMNQGDQAKSYRESFVRGRNTVESTLWNGEYYGLMEGEGRRICFADALNGQWYADMLGLGNLLEPERIHKMLTAVFRYNYPATPFGIVNGFIPGKGIDYPKQAGYFQTQTASVWTGTTFSVASLGLYRGFYDEPLGAVKEVHDNYAYHLGNLWNMRESIDAESGLPMAWPYYYRPMSAWSVLLGLEGFRYNASRSELAIQPLAKVDFLKAPLIVPGVLGEIIYSRKNRDLGLSVSVKEGLLNLKEIRLPELPAESTQCSIASATIVRDVEGKQTLVTLPHIEKIKAGDTFTLTFGPEKEQKKRNSP